MPSAKLLSPPMNFEVVDVEQLMTSQTRAMRFSLKVRTNCTDTKYLTAFNGLSQIIQSRHQVTHAVKYNTVEIAPLVPGLGCRVGHT